MAVTGLHISPHRTNYFFLWYGVLLLLFIAPYVALAQNNTVTRNSTSTCPSGYKCFSSESRNVTVELGYNGYVCKGRTAQQCYGESDPRGFVAGPRQNPVVIYQGDRLIVKFSEKYNFAAKLYNVSRSAFDSCNFTMNAVPVIPDLTKMPFEIPAKYINTTGITYFIGETDNMVIQCQFGLKLEVNVRSREKCTSPSLPVHGVCSSKGLCATYGQFFTFNASCVCNTGYLGPYCGERNSCHSTLNPCLNEATCIDKKSGLEDDYNCSCVAGYEGKNCENNVDDCKSSPCRNGSICLDELNGYQCLCQPGYFGTNCEKLVPNPCELKPCKNGGTCERAGYNRQNYTCKCPQGFQGRNCTENVTISSSVIVTTSILSSTGKSSVVSDVLNQTSSLDATHLSTQEGVTSMVSPSLNASGQTTTTSQTSLLTQLTSSVSHSVITQSLSYSTHFSPSSTFTPAPSLNTNPSISMSSQSSLARNQISSLSSSFTSVVTEVISEIFPSLSSLSTATVSSLTTVLPASTLEVVQTSTVNDSSFMSTTSSTLSTVQVSSSTFSVSSSMHSVTATISLTTMVTSRSSVITAEPSSLSSSTTPLLSTMVTSRSSVITVEPSSLSLSTTVTSSTPLLSTMVISSLPSVTVEPSATTVTSSSDVSSSSSSTVTSSTPLLSTMVISSFPSVTLEPSATATTTVTSSSDVSSSSSSSTVTSSTPLLSTMVITSFPSVTLEPSATATTTVTSSSDVSSSSSSMQPQLSTGPLISTQIIPSSTFSTVTSPSSSINPTTLPPTTIPLTEQTCKDNPCNNGTCLDVPDQYGLNFTCRCPKPTYGPRCSTDFKLHFPRFSNGSYLVHKPIAFGAGFNKIVITFKTTAANGLLFYSTHSKYKDFIQLYITEGKLEYRFDPGDYTCVIKSNTAVNTGNIVIAVVTYDSRNKEGSLQVDNNPKQTKTSPGKWVGIGLYNDWFIGGMPPGKTIGSNDGGQATSTFTGCIKDIELNGDQIGFEEATDWNDISECDTPCNGTHRPCQNNGQCIPDPVDPHDYECKCPDGFEGTNCKNPTVCSGDPCKGGLCIIDKSTANMSRICLCPFGRGGRDCNTELNITTPKFTMVYNYSSFIRYQVPTLSGPYFDITLQFKIDPNSTAWNNALLMFSGQNEYQGKGDDFIALGINNSRVLLQYNLGSGIASIASDAIGATREWHSLTAGRNGREGYLYLDDQSVKRGSSPGQLTGLNLFSPLYIGGVPDLTELPTDVLFKRGFEGSITNGAVQFKDMQPIRLLMSQQPSSANEWPVVEGRNIVEDGYNGCNTSQPCQNNGTCTQKGATIVCSCVDGWQGMYCASREVPCVNHNPCAAGSTCREVNNKAVCDCPLGKTGDTCSNTISIQRPQFQENSYMAFTPTVSNIRVITQITIKFIPYNENGLLFYVAHKITTQKGDFLSISLHNGFVQYRYDLGGGIDPKQNQRKISLNDEHTVTITRNEQTGTLKVDNETTISGKSPGSAVALDTSSNFYLGGVPQLSLVNPSAVADVKSLKDFVGCVTSVTINDIQLKLAETGAAEGRNVNNCPAPKAAADDNFNA